MMAPASDRGWHGFWSRSGMVRWLAPLAALFAALARRRHRRHIDGLDGAWRAPVPVIVVGNISVGGTGKTPMVIWLLDYLQRRGWRPGVVSRGYGGRRRVEPLRVTAASDPRQCGDEPLLIARRSGVPVVVAQDRVAAVRRLLTEGVNIILSDDGLQHYRLARDVEVVMIDGRRGHGNGRCLPAGPLREAPDRLASVDLTVATGDAAAEFGHLAEYRMALEVRAVLEPDNINPVGLDRLPSGPVHAVAGIGDPEQFFSTLAQFGCELLRHPYPDHHVFRWQELDFDEPWPILMTEKDMMRCLPDLSAWPAALRERCLAVVVEAVPDPDWEAALADVMMAKGCVQEHRA